MAIIFHSNTHYFHLLGIRKHIKCRGTLINETVSKFSLSAPKMSKRSRDIEWSKVSGALPKPKGLHLEEDEQDGLFHCPVPTKNHLWFYHFDEQPDLSQIQIQVTNRKRLK